MQPAVRSGPVPLLQQRMEQNPQAPLTAPPSAAANPPDLPLPPKILNIKKEVKYDYANIIIQFLLHKTKKMYV